MPISEEQVALHRSRQPVQKPDCASMALSLLTDWRPNVAQPFAPAPNRPSWLRGAQQSARQPTKSRKVRRQRLRAEAAADQTPNRPCTRNDRPGMRGMEMAFSPLQSRRPLKAGSGVSAARPTGFGRLAGEVLRPLLAQQQLPCASDLVALQAWAALGRNTGECFPRPDHVGRPLGRAKPPKSATA